MIRKNIRSHKEKWIVLLVESHLQHWEHRGARRTTSSPIGRCQRTKTASVKTQVQPYETEPRTRSRCFKASTIIPTQSTRTIHFFIFSQNTLNSWNSSIPVLSTWFPASRKKLKENNHTSRPAGWIFSLTSDTLMSCFPHHSAAVSDMSDSF